MESFFKKYVAENSKWNFFLRKMWQRKVKEESLSIPPGGSYPVSGIINMRWPGQYVGQRPSTNENLDSFFAWKRSEVSIGQWANPHENLKLYFAGIGIVLSFTGFDQADTLSSK